MIWVNTSMSLHMSKGVKSLLISSSDSPSHTPVFCSQNQSALFRIALAKNFNSVKIWVKREYFDTVALSFEIVKKIKK